MKYRVCVLGLGLLSVTLFVSPARSQGHGGHGFAPAGHNGANGMRHNTTGSHFGRTHRGRRNFVGYGFGPNYYPYYNSDYDPNYDNESGAPEPPIRAQVAAPASEPKPPESLVMELRGDHWVQLTSHGPMEVAGQAAEPQPAESHPARAGSSAKAKQPGGPLRAELPSELPPAVLVFRDGHQEEVTKYTIVGNTISIKTDIWSTGSWMRKVLIADLNLPATLRANQERGTKFSLPSRSTEVIVR